MRRKELEEGGKGVLISGLAWRLQCMTLQKVVSAHAAAAAAAAGVLVIRRSMQSHANSRQARSSCIVCLGLAQAAQGLASSLVCQSCSDIAVGGGEREITVRQQGLLG